MSSNTLKCKSSEPFSGRGIFSTQGIFKHTRNRSMGTCMLAPWTDGALIMSFFMGVALCLTAISYKTFLSTNARTLRHLNLRNSSQGVRKLKEF